MIALVMIFMEIYFCDTERGPLRARTGSRELITPAAIDYYFGGDASCTYRTERLTSVPGVDYVHTEGMIRFECGEAGCVSLV